MLIDILAQTEDRHREIERFLTLPEVISDNKKYTSLIKEYNSITPIVEKYREYRSTEAAISDAEEIISDPNADSELKALAREELVASEELLSSLKRELQILLIPKDPNDDRNVIVEIRQGAGGEEAALFAYDLFRMYSMYATKLRFALEVLNANETELGGYKEITFMISGSGAYSRFKFESGVHRVQRIPVTESNGRIQTSTVTVAVLPEVEAIEVEINPADIKIESCKSSGAGGQHINKTESAVRLTHKPSGIVIECDQERSQLQNKEKAMRLLRAKLYDIQLKEQNDRIASDRKSQVGTGERSEKIRTYNYPQSRITDHRIGKTIFTFDAFLNGDIGGLVDDLISEDTARKFGGDDGEN